VYRDNRHSFPYFLKFILQYKVENVRLNSIFYKSIY